MNVEIFYNFHLERGRDMSCGPFSIRVGLYHELQAAGIKYIYIYILFNEGSEDCLHSLK